MMMTRIHFSSVTDGGEIGWSWIWRAMSNDATVDTIEKILVLGLN